VKTTRKQRRANRKDAEMFRQKDEKRKDDFKKARGAFYACIHKRSIVTASCVSDEDMRANATGECHQTALTSSTD